MSKAWWVWATACLGGATVAAQPAPTKVVQAPVELRPLPATVTLIGTVEPLRRSVVGAEIAGIAVQVPAREGDVVQAGQLLCRLNDDRLAFQLAEARGRWQALQAVQKRWEFESQRVERLYGVDQANEKEKHDTQTAYDEARFAVVEQQAVVDRIASDLGKTSIVAPFAGRIVARHVEVGEWIDAGGAVVEMVDLSSVLVRVHAPELAWPYIAVGDPATVRIVAVGDTFVGRIKHVIPQADPGARTFPIDVELPNPDALLSSGMSAWATVVSGPKQDMLAVPKDALIDLGGGSFSVALVQTQKTPDGHEITMAMPVPVTVGAEEGAYIAITSRNLEPGAMVVTYGNERLAYPQPVQVVADAAGTGEVAKP